jgi:hypothetical protein
VLVRGGLPLLLRHRFSLHRHTQLLVLLYPRRSLWQRWCTTTSASSEDDKTTTTTSVGKTTKYHLWADDPEFRKWKSKEEEILKDIEPIVSLTKEILHSDRYSDGERLTDEDAKAVVDKLLAYHPHCEDKIGVGLDSIMVDRHPQFRNSRCLFVVRADGGWIDFSYQKCLRAYVKDKYPSDAEKFIREHFKRGR